MPPLQERAANAQIYTVLQITRNMHCSNGTAAENAMDALSGMVTGAQAERIAAGAFGNVETLMKVGRMDLTAEELACLTTGEWDWLRAQGATSRISINDRVYRVFNAQPCLTGTRESESRKVILGKAGAAVTLNLHGDLSKAADSLPIERDSRIAVRGLSFQPDSEFASTPSTTLRKLAGPQNGAVVDYSSIVSELKNTDLVGLVVELGPVRRATNGTGTALAECKISDLKSAAHATFWGSSALAIAAIKPNSWIKIEFCNVWRSESNEVVVSAGSSSRIFSHEALGSRRHMPLTVPK
jgi:hypothetical protein